jgi:hypothetical protein
MRWLQLFSLMLTTAQVCAVDRPFERLDHFYAVSAKPQQLFEFFSETLELPIVWPYQEFTSHASGAVSLGNVVFEMLHAPQSDTEFHGIAYFPTEKTNVLRRQLESLGVELDQSTPFYDSSGRVLFENTTLKNLSSESMTVFVCDFRDRSPVARSRTVAAEELARRRGGAIGVSAVSEIHIGAKAPGYLTDERAMALQVMPHNGALSAEPGPKIVILPSDQDRVLGVKVRVRSLRLAKDWLATKGLWASDSGESVTIAAAAVQGHQFILVE